MPPDLPSCGAWRWGKFAAGVHAAIGVVVGAVIGSSVGEALGTVVVAVVDAMMGAAIAAVPPTAQQQGRNSAAVSWHEGKVRVVGIWLHARKSTKALHRR